MKRTSIVAKPVNRSLAEPHERRDSLNRLFGQDLLDQFEVPGPEHWSERIDAALSTLEVAYAKAHEDAAGTGTHAHYAAEMLSLSDSVARLIPNEPDALALAATIQFAEARRPARVSAGGDMVRCPNRSERLGPDAD